MAPHRARVDIGTFLTDGTRDSVDTLVGLSVDNVARCSLIALQRPCTKDSLAAANWPVMPQLFVVAQREKTWDEIARCY